MKYRIFIYFVCGILVHFIGCAVSRGGFYYTIKRGDTLSDVSIKFNIDKEKILDFNNTLKADSLNAGKIIYIPSPKETPAKSFKKTFEKSQQFTKKKNNSVKYPSDVSAKKKEKSVKKKAKPKATVTTQKQIVNSDLSSAVKIIKDIDFSWPVNGKVAQFFSKTNRGILIEAVENSEIKSAADGIVAHCGELPGYGNTVVIKHGNYFFTVYSFLKEILVTLNQPVTKLSVLGKAGKVKENENSTKPSLHFEIRKMENDNPVAINPLLYLD